MPQPSTSNEWRLIAENFMEMWGFPNCIGAIDGKHVVLKAPCNTGSLYFNYKNTFSMVLLALVDANLKFVYIDIGSYGRNSDGGIFAHSSLGKGLSTNQLNLPPDTALPGGTHLGPMPYVIIGDEAFPLQRNLMRPFPGKCCTNDQKLYNYRLSRARRIVENAFGILACRWRVYHTHISVKPCTAKSIVKATCVLHNMLQSQSTPAQIQALQQEYDEMTECSGLQNIAAVGNRAGEDAISIREVFVDYFANVHQLHWQNDYIQRGHFTE